MMRGYTPHHIALAFVPVLFFMVSPSFAGEPTHVLTVTAYNAVRSQTSSHPDVTASGVRSNPETIAAVAPRLLPIIPFGSVVRLTRIKSTNLSPNCGLPAVKHLIGYRIIADVMNPRMRGKIDVLLPTSARVDGKRVNPATELGVCHDVLVKVVARIDLSDPSSIPKSQAELAALVREQQGIQMVFNFSGGAQWASLFACINISIC